MKAPLIAMLIVVAACNRADQPGTSDVAAGATAAPTEETSATPVLDTATGTAPGVRPESEASTATDTSDRMTPRPNDDMSPRSGTAQPQ
jgi:hypothetical protein